MLLTSTILIWQSQSNLTLPAWLDFTVNLKTNAFHVHFNFMFPPTKNKTSMEVSNHCDDIPNKLPGCVSYARRDARFIPSIKSVIWITLKLWYIHRLEKQAQRLLAGMKGRNCLCQILYIAPWAVRIQMADAITALRFYASSSFIINTQLCWHLYTELNIYPHSTKY